jgi:hypothetical protein
MIPKNEGTELDFLYYYNDVIDNIKKNYGYINDKLARKVVFLYNNLNLYNPNVGIIDVIKNYNGNGFSYNLIVDNKCVFYFIHPDENIIVRNKYGKNVDNYISSKITNILLYLIYSDKIYNYKHDFYKFIKNEKYIDLEK